VSKNDYLAGDDREMRIPLCYLVPCRSRASKGILEPVPKTGSVDRRKGAERLG